MGNNKESPDNRLLDMATLGCVFSRHNVLKDRSHSVNEIDDAHKKKNKTKQNKNKNKKKNAQTCLRFSGKSSRSRSANYGLGSDELAQNTTGCLPCYYCQHPGSR